MESEDLQKALAEIMQAHQVISAHMAPSPLRKSIWLSELTQGEVWLKLESLNPNGSFKARGALNAVAKLKQKHPSHTPLKICAASAGNHAQGVAFAAKKLGGEAHIFLPDFAPLVKRTATEKLGARIYTVAGNIEVAFAAALEFAEKEHAHFLHAFNNHDVIMGQATCAYETLQQLREIKKQPDFSPDYFVTSVGGGGLAAGCGLLFHIQSQTKVIGVEQEDYNSGQKSLELKRQVGTEKNKTTIADGIAVSMIGNLNYEYMTRFVEKISTVNDDLIAQAILRLCEQEHLIAEGAGATAIAEILKNPAAYKNKTVVACVSGGNVDPQLLTRILARGLHLTGRVLRLSLCVHDRPGGLKHLLEHVSAMGGNVLDLIHDRTYSQVSVGDVDVELSLETRNLEHQKLLIEKLEEAGFRPRVHH